MLTRFQLDKAYAINTLIKKTAILVQKHNRKMSPSKKECYQSMVGCIIFSTVKTMFNIAFTTFVANYFIKNPSHQYTKVMITILCYLKGLKKREIIYNDQNKLKVEQYPNFNWASNKES